MWHVELFHVLEKKRTIKIGTILVNLDSLATTHNDDGQKELAFMQWRSLPRDVENILAPATLYT